MNFKSFFIEIASDIFATTLLATAFVGIRYYLGFEVALIGVLTYIIVKINNLCNLISK